MKILYISPAGTKVDLLDLSDISDYKVFEMDSIRKTISKGIRNEFDNIELIEVIDILDRNSSHPEDILDEYDLILCDLTTANPNVLYLAGKANALGKPTIYIISNESVVPYTLEHKLVFTYSEASLEKEFRMELHKLISRAVEDPLFLLDEVEKENQSKVFISYSHKDKDYLNRLMVHLKPLTKSGLLDVWVDTKIKTGDKWQEMIESALANASIAILIVSADFMASDFIIDNELPPLLAQAEVKGVKVLPVIVSPCRFSRDKTLNRFQSVNSPDKPLSSISHDEREMVYDKLMADIENSLENA